MEDVDPPTSPVFIFQGDSAITDMQRMMDESFTF
jgi:hypothetical protein